MILKHRDTEVLRFAWVEPQGVRILSVNEAAKRFLPLDFHGAATDENLDRWIRRRLVPKHRHYIEIMLGNLGLARAGARELIAFSKGLSLNDVYWVTEDADTADWATSNLYANPFSKVLAQMAFTGGIAGEFKPARDLTTSPEFTTNGMLAKCWRRGKDGTISLYKSGTEGAGNTGFEPYSEFYAAQLAEAGGFGHVAYDLAHFKGLLCSTCPLFTNEHVGYLPAGRLLSREEALADTRFHTIFFFDALIFNTDRHLGNFGYLIDNDTNEIMGAAPIFDNGYGLFSLAVYRPGSPHDEFGDLRKFTGRTYPALYNAWLGFPGGVTAEMKARAEKLRGFRFKLHEHFNLSRERLSIIESFIQNRISKIIEFGNDADRFVNISTKSDKIKNNLVGSRIYDLHSLANAVLSNLRADPFITIDTLAEILQCPRATLVRQMDALKREGSITREGSRKKGYWKVLT